VIASRAGVITLLPREAQCNKSPRQTVLGVAPANANHHNQCETDMMEGQAPNHWEEKLKRGEVIVTGASTKLTLQDMLKLT